MSIHSASTTARTFPRFGKGLAALAAGGALALAVAAGIGIQQSGDRTATTTEPVTVTSKAKTVARPAADTTTTVYVTSSAEETARIQAGIEEANNIRHLAGEAPLQHMVLTGDSAEATLVLRDLQYQEDSANVRVVDMRTRPATTDSAGSTGQDLPWRDTPHFTP